MGWRVLVKPLSTADVAGNVVSQKFRHPSRAMVIRQIALGFAFYGNPTFTDLRLRIYSDRGGSPGKLIEESSTIWTKAQIRLAQDHGLKFCTFFFNYVQLQANTYYHLVLVPTGYTGVDASFLGWKYAYPDPQYPLVTTEDAAAAARHHLEFSLFGYTLGAAD